MNDDYLNTALDGDYANYGADVFEPVTRAAGDAYQQLAARGEPYAAMGQGQNLRRMEMAGSFGGQMPTAEALGSMNQSMGLTKNRYGATSPDPGGVEAIASKNIDRMGLMAEEEGSTLPPAGKRASFQQTMEEAKQKHLNDSIKRINETFAQKAPAASPSRWATPAWQQRAEKVLTQPKKEEGFSFTRELAATMGKERFEKLVKDLSKLTAKLPVAIAKSKKPADPTAYLEHVSGFRSKKR